MIRIITIHIVSSDAVMLGWKNTIAPAVTGSRGARSSTTCGAGSSKFALIRSAMPLTGVPGLPGAYGGTTRYATTSSATTAAMIAR